MIKEAKVKEVVVSKLKPHPDNDKIYGSEDVQELADQIKQSEWIKPLIVTQDNVIVSGHRRYAAALLLGRKSLPCEIEVFEHEWQVIERLLLENKYREKTQVQRTREFKKWKEVEQGKARERQIDLAGTRPNISDLVDNCPQGETGKARDKAAEISGLGSGRRAEDAVKALDKADALAESGEQEKANLLLESINLSKSGAYELTKFIETLTEEEAANFADDLKSGKKTVSQVKRIIENEYRRQRISEQFEEAPDLPSEKKYRIIYADPPWIYDKGKELSDKYGDVKKHYPPMETVDICNLPVSGLCENDCVLFLWATAPKLPEALEVMKAWGFQYKTCVVWDKVGHNFGYYFSVRHELLLIGGKGSSTPDSRELHDSVISIEKSRKHSEKPEYFRGLIDKMYQSGNRIELFARNQIDGWDKWGNEV